MSLYLVIVDDNLNWCGVVERKPLGFWEEYLDPEGGVCVPSVSGELVCRKGRTLFNFMNGCCHWGPSYLFDVSVWDWRAEWKETSVAWYFSEWYKSELVRMRIEKMEELGI